MKISRYPYRCTKGHEIMLNFEEPPEHLNCQAVVGAGAFCMAYATLVKDTQPAENGRLYGIVGDAEETHYPERARHIDRTGMRPPKQGEPKDGDS